MNILEHIINTLKADARIILMTQDRIYSAKIPQGAKMPYIFVEQITNPRTDHFLNRHSELPESSLQINIFTKVKQSSELLRKCVVEDVQDLDLVDPNIDLVEVDEDITITNLDANESFPQAVGLKITHN